MGFDKLVNGWTVVFPLAVLLYYFFRKRYETTTISSTLFWEQSMRETRVSPYLKNLQRNALFYLQMAALLLIVFILLGPYLTKEEAVGGHTILIVDTSATMLASNEGTSLFARNQEAMKELVASRPGEPITIMTTGKEPIVVIREETDGEAIMTAIDKLTVTYEHEYMERAIEFAKSITTTGAAIHIYTDSLDQATFSEGESAITWTIHGDENPKINVSIDKFGAVKTPEGTEAIIRITNDSDDTQIGAVHIKDLLTGNLLIAETFSIEGEEEVLLSFKELPESKLLRAEIVVEDDYEVDNTAYILLGNETGEAVVDGHLHELVKRAFEAVGLTVTTGSTTEMLAAQEESIIVTNDVSFLKKGTKPVIIVGRNDKSTEPVAGAVQNTSDPLFTVANISDVYVSALYPSFKSYTTIATVGDKPFIQKSKRGDIVILADIELTDWPLHPSFPLFVWSTVELLRSETDSLGLFVPNERKAVLSGRTENGLEIYTIDDEYVTTITDGSSFIAPTRPGIYKALDGGVEKMFAVLLEKSEKELVQGSSYQIGHSENVKGNEEGKNRIGWLFLVPLLLLLLIEWEVQRRRGYPN
ncbi:BatA domain-containing protein [Sporosarcina sp. resist]|uniref:vWA domain-containing protein n=1 Tax=Sporosarcina sp. resist TaxID=2762563 RepID=UPI00164EBD41|nr:BatA and WFA domain-containing protein [Sporosarcina sp. resist]QNK87107.1 BatA domain-containing protein [Sporosarcina sp. resist]